MNPTLTLIMALLLAPTFALYANENVSTDLLGRMGRRAGRRSGHGRARQCHRAQVKGAHDAELAIVNRHTYVVADVDDKRRHWGRFA